MKPATPPKARATVVALVVFLLASVGSVRASFAQPLVAPPEDAADAAPGPGPGSGLDADGGAAPLEPSPVVLEDAGVPPPEPPPVVSAEPAAEALAPAGASAEAGEKKKSEEETERSPLVPGVDARQWRKKPLDPKMTLKPGKGVSISSADGQFELNMKMRAQIRGTLERAPEETLLGAAIRRARLWFDGHMFGKHNRYKFELAVAPGDSAMQDGVVGTAPLLDWYLTFDYLKEATIVTGQYKVPFNRQRVISSGSLQVVDRSIVQGEFTLDRNVGVDVRSTSLLDGHLHYYAGVYAGEGKNASELRDYNLIYLARVEILPTGKFNDYVEADFERTGPRVAIGGSYAHVSNSPRDRVSVGSAPADGGTTTFDTTETDILLKMYGLSVNSEVFWREGDRKLGGAVDDSGVPIQMARPRDGYGGFGQFGFLLPHTMLEVVGRYGMMRPTSAEKSSLAHRQELGGGLTHYFARHSFKLQADYFRLWRSDAIADGTDQIRVQIEAGF